MNELINPTLVQNRLSDWRELTSVDPLWYQQVAPVIKEWYKQFPSLTDPVRERIKNQLYGFFEQGMEQKWLILGQNNDDLDKFRQPIDTVVIHHTSQFPGVSWERLSSMGLVRQYVIPFYELSDYKGIITRGRSIWSNHYRVDGQQVFYAYHWLVRNNGDCERLLEDNNVGFHAGEVNSRSVGITIDDRIWNQSPSPQVITAIAELINTQYPQVPQNNIIGHCEASPHTACPGQPFLTTWKTKLLTQIKAD